jgi:plastocyanin
LEKKFMRSSIHHRTSARFTRSAFAGLAALACGLAQLACGGAPAPEAPAAPPAAPTVTAAATTSTPPPPSAVAEAPAAKPVEAPPAGATGVISGKLTGKPKQIQHAVVFISDLSGELSSESAKLDQKGQTFLPHVLAVAKGTTVEFANSDATGHNVFSPDGEKYDLGTFNLGESRKYRFEKKGVYTQLCKLHPSMLAYVVVLENKWFALSGEDGSFRIEGVPAGERVIEAWQEKGRGAPTKVTVVAGREAKIEIAMAKP